MKAGRNSTQQKIQVQEKYEIFFLRNGKLTGERFFINCEKGQKCQLL